MSIHYGFDLIFPRAGLVRAARALARRANPEGYAGCTLQVSGEGSLCLPFEADSEDGPLTVFEVGRSEPTQWLIGSLWLPIDEAVRDYLHTHPGAPTRSTASGEEASIGHVSVFIGLGVQYVVIGVGAVGSRMSAMFEASPAVRAVMLATLREGDGLAVVLSRERGWPCERLDRPGLDLAVDHHDPDDPADVDRFAAEVLRG